MPCLFCDSENPIASSRHSHALEDRYPVNPGHTLVIPKRHATGIFELEFAEQADLWQLVAQVREHLIETLNPAGFNIGLNEGAAAGQTVPHAHVHIIPRFDGDMDDPRGGVRRVIPDKAAYWDR